MISKPDGRERKLEATLDLRNHTMGNSKLYVGNMSFNTSEDELRTTFGQFGAVTDVYVAMDKMTGRPRGFAFVTMGTPEEAKTAIEKLNGVDLGGRALVIGGRRFYFPGSSPGVECLLDEDVSGHSLSGMRTELPSPRISRF